MKKFGSALCLILLTLAAGCTPLTNGAAYLPSPSDVQKLKNLSVIKEGERLVFGAGWMEMREGNRILHLKGSPYEMGYQHGVLLKEDIAQGVVPVFADPVSGLSTYRSLPKWVRSLIILYLDFTLYSPVERNQPGEYLSELKGIADGSGTDFRVVLRANFLSDLAMHMTPVMVKQKVKALGPFGECSSMVVSGPATADGKLIFGRNTDYSGQGRYAPHQVITFYEPNQGYRYAKICTAGLLKCNSAMNEKGIVIGGHFMPFSGSDPKGYSFTILENEIMRKAENLDGALSLIRNVRRGGSFGLMIADGKTGGAMAVEATRDLLGMRRMANNALCLTNYAITPELKPTDLAAKYNLEMRDVAGRYARLERLIDEKRGNITPALAAEFMSDHVDAVLHHERGAGFTVCSVNNVESAIFVPQDGLFWVATGKEPVCMNPYVGFDFKAEFSGSQPRVSPRCLPGYQWADPLKNQGLSAYMDAFIAYLKNPADKARAMSLLTEARKADPHEAVYARLVASFLVNQGDFAGAIALLTQTLGFSQTPNEKAMTFLLLGQAHDIAGERDKAVSLYEEVVSLRKRHGNDHLTGINDLLYGKAKKGLKKPLRKGGVEEFAAFGMGSGYE